jgi:hypothetical protein
MAYPGPVFEKVPEGLNEGLGGLETTGRESLGRAEKIVPRGTMGAFLRVFGARPGSS